MLNRTRSPAQVNLLSRVRKAEQTCIPCDHYSQHRGNRGNRANTSPTRATPPTPTPHQTCTLHPSPLPRLGGISAERCALDSHALSDGNIPLPERESAKRRLVPLEARRGTISQVLFSAGCIIRTNIGHVPGRNSASHVTHQPESGRLGKNRFLK